MTEVILVNVKTIMCPLNMTQLGVSIDQYPGILALTGSFCSSPYRTSPKRNCHVKESLHSLLTLGIMQTRLEPQIAIWFLKGQNVSSISIRPERKVAVVMSQARKPGVSRESLFGVRVPVSMKQWFPRVLS